MDRSRDAAGKNRTGGKQRRADAIFRKRKSASGSGEAANVAINGIVWKKNGSSNRWDRTVVMFNQ